MANPASDVVMGDAGEVMADATRIARITQFSFNPKVGESAWGDSDSKGYTMRKGARKDGSGGMAGQFDKGTNNYRVLKVGDEPELVLWVCTTIYYYLPCALIANFNFSVNQDSKEVVGWSSDFGASGIFYQPGDAGIPAKVYPVF
jgi:hypothetical protein